MVNNKNSPEQINSETLTNKLHGHYNLQFKIFSLSTLLAGIFISGVYVYKAYNFPDQLSPLREGLIYGIVFAGLLSNAVLYYYKNKT